MKGFRKSTRIAKWVLRALIISSALLLFSISGIVALQPASHAISLIIADPSTTVGATSSPADMPTPTPTIGITPTPIPTVPPSPTAQPTQPPPPKLTPTPIPTNPTRPPAATATPVPPTNTPVPIIGVTPTNVALGPVVPPGTHKGTPTVTPGPTPSGSPTTNQGNTPIQGSSNNGNTGSPSTHQPDPNGGIMATIKPLIVPIAGVSTTILLGSVGLLAFMFWRKRTAAQGIMPSFALASGLWSATQTRGSAQPTELAPAQNKPMSPFAMQSIVQYSPLLGAPDTSHLDAPVAPPASDFRPLPIDYPQIMEVHTDKTPVLVTPASLQSLSPATGPEFQPALQLASTPFSPPAASIEASPTQSPSIQTPRPPAQQMAPVAYQFPQQDPLLENLMQQAQMGIFALPGKEA